MSITPNSAQFADDVQVPNYDRKVLKSRIVHLGLGAFHRGHQAVYHHELLNQAPSDWGICAINLVGGEQLIKSLREQDHRYTVLEQDSEGQSWKNIGSIHATLHPELDGLNAVLEKLAEPQVAIISLTITEKGYCVQSGSGALDWNNSAIIHDISHPDRPISALGVLAAGFRLRQRRGLTPVTVLSCDNIPENGQVIRKALLEFCDRQDPELAQWIRANITFPSTMVDRIVPAMTPAALELVSHKLGVTDDCAIVCEPFRQWVIEDNFIAGRPEWEHVGPQLVKDVVPFEEMKLRMLNGSHSFLAYLGFLAGYTYIYQCMEDPAFKRATLKLMLQEQAPTLTIGSDVDLEAYAQILIHRFANQEVKHQTAQIACDGSQKLPQRILEPMRKLIAMGKPFPCQAMAIAGWLRYLSGSDENNHSYQVNDPLFSSLNQTLSAAQNPEQKVLALLSCRDIFPQDLATNPAVIAAVTDSYRKIITKGTAAAVAELSL